MDFYINNFLISNQNQDAISQTEMQEKDSSNSSKNNESPFLNTEANQQNKEGLNEQFKSDNTLKFEEEFSKNTPQQKKSKNCANSSFAIRKKVLNQSEDIIQNASFNRNICSSRGQIDSRNDKPNLNVFNNTFMTSKGFNSGQIDKELFSKEEASILAVDDYDNYSLDEGDALSYFELNYISQTGTNQQVKKIKRVKKTYLDQLPEANPIAKRELRGIEQLKSVYDFSLKFKEQQIVNSYLEQFHMATENPEEFHKLVQRKEPLGVRNINAINTNYTLGNSNPGVPVNADGSQARQFIYQMFTEDNNIVYLKNPLLNNQVLCTLYKMSAIRNGEPYSDFKSKEASEITQQERLEQMIKENLTKKQKVLHFDSKFESGNLSIVSMKSSNEYNLLLQNDINTKGYTQWFFFSVKKTHRNQSVKFNIVNFYKNGSLFNEGMKISIFSKKKYDLTKVSWFKGATDISYIKNNIVKQNDNYFYTLTFKCTFEYNDDEVFFAYNIPYTYTQLNQFLHKCEVDPYKNQFIYKKLLCRTLIGNKLDLITITNPCKNIQDEMSQRKGVIITARVHPGETVSSYIMEGIIEFLLQNTKEAHFLREKFIFKIIPMMNPDGVIHGNYRCSLAGCDLNRRWKNPNQTLHPEIYYSKQMIFDFKQKNEIAMIIDLHGHSRKMNVFAYGCHDKKKPFECREFPFIISKLNSSFSFKDCNFKVQKNREGTARIALYKSLGIPNIYTIESSFCGDSYLNTHFTVEHLKEMGHSICQSILMKFQMANFQQYLNQEEQQENQQQQQLNQELENKTQPKKTEIPSFFSKVCSQQNLTSNKIFLDELYDNPENIDIGMKNDSGSDSEPSGDNMSDDELKKIFTSKTKKSKKLLDKNTKEVITIQPQYQIKDPMSQTQTMLKRKTQSNFMTKSPEKKINSSQQGTSSSEVKQKAFNFDKAPSPIRSRTAIKNSFHQTGQNFVKDLKNQRVEKESQNQMKNMTVLEPKFVYFPLKIPDAFPNIDKYKNSLRETKLRKLRENSQVRQQMGNPQQTHRVIQMKLRQGYNNGAENQSKIEKKPQLISPREFKFNQAIPQPIENTIIDSSLPVYSGIRDSVNNTNKSQLGRILRTIMNTQTPDWIYGYSGNNSQHDTLNKSLVQEGSQTLTRRGSKNMKQQQQLYNQSPPSTNPVEKSQRSKSNDISQYVFKMQKYDIFNGTFTNLPDQSEANKQSNRSLHENQFYQPTFCDYKSLQKAKFDQAFTGVPPSANSASNSLNNSFASINNTLSKQRKIIKPQSASRTVRKQLTTNQYLMNGRKMLQDQPKGEFEGNNVNNNGGTTLVVDEKNVNQQTVFQPIKIVYI
ncbi:hypothetical protein ABPG72_007127 [Tetrahymena utriculariae]